jgi:putative transposase
MRCQVITSFADDGKCTIKEGCESLGITRQGYYKRQDTSLGEAGAEEVTVKMIADIRHDACCKYGGRKLKPLLEERGRRIGRDRLFSLMRRNGLCVVPVRNGARTTYSYYWMRHYPNLIKGVKPEGRNRIWVCDITYVRLEDGTFCYLHLVTDMFSRRIMGWCVSPTLETRYTKKAMRMAIRQAGGRDGGEIAGLICHSDRGCQYCSNSYVHMLEGFGMRPSMNEHSDPRENAIAERVNGIIKNEYLKGKKIKDIHEAYSAVANAIRCYNTMRPHMSLNYATPESVYRISKVNQLPILAQNENNVQNQAAFVQR